MKKFFFTTLLELVQTLTAIIFGHLTLKQKQAFYDAFMKEFKAARNKMENQ